MVETKMLGFELLKELYSNDRDFGNIYKDCENGALKESYRHDEFLFKGTNVCVPKSSKRELFVKETHGGLMGHFIIQKTLDMLHDHFYWPCMKHDVHFFFL